MGTCCTLSSAAKDKDDGSSIDLDLNFQLSLCNEGTSKLGTNACNDRRALEKQPVMDLKLSLTVRPSESVVTDVELKAAQSDVLYPDAPRALEDEQTAVFVMVGAKDVNLLAASRFKSAQGSTDFCKATRIWRFSRALFKGICYEQHWNQAVSHSSLPILPKVLQCWLRILLRLLFTH
ncbi:hypothetical protein ZEAMMB73_Zm00001d037044 [Zea mays]|uniref:Uncharacterized protein n=1 Tax=Zea mays TaxID=4577 RepID=A0A1D6LTG0_MAIZE|nr:hypothetical protein ZEAMMB73_Zm00001d037044 [Zea mays]